MIRGLIFFSAFMFSITSSFASVIKVESPDKTIAVSINLIKGQVFYNISKLGQKVIRKSLMGNTLDKKDLSKNLELIKSERYSKKSTWETLWGEMKEIKDHHQGVKLFLQSDNFHMNIDFRVFNDGVAFRYEFPAVGKLKTFNVLDEVTEFRLNRNDQIWWIPGFADNRYEYLYNKNKIDQVNVMSTPATVEKINGLVVAFHEARLLDYSSYALRKTADDTLKVDLYPWAGTNVRVYGKTPLVSPWRTIQIAIDPAQLVESTMILNLNDPAPSDRNYDFASTGKYVGVWWGMQLGKYSWERGPKHGATNENVKMYIDFAAKHDLDGVLVEGWNIGWDGDWMNNGALFRFDQPYDHYDIGMLTKYAQDKGVTLIGHHETSGNTKNYESQLDAAYNFLNKHKIKAVKTGYVGTRLDHKEWHHGQYGVAHYTKAMKKGFDSEVMMVVHEPIKQTGLRRTYPNLMSAEGLRGQEYNAWGHPGNTPAHTTIIPFTRSLAGPVDFTPGAFDTRFDQWQPESRVPTTLAKQLALYVVIYSPWQMLCDLPENYEMNLPALQFMKDVPTNWDKTVGLNSKIGEFTTIARKDRNSENWYLGSITNEDGRVISVDLDFLDEGAWYTVKGYQDARGASWVYNPNSIDIYTTRVQGGATSYDLYLAPGGGVALEFIKE
jgi:alpha-glucosidase